MVNGTATHGDVLQIVGPDGSVLNKPTAVLLPQEAEIFRAYQKIKDKYGFTEANYCRACWNSTREDGMKGHVTPGEIALECRCRSLVYRGLM